MKRIIYQIGSLLTRLLNIVVFFGNAHTTTSARAYDRGADSRSWELFRKAIDLLFSPFEKEHCKRTWEGRVDRAHQTIARDAELKATTR